MKMSKRKYDLITCNEVVDELIILLKSTLEELESYSNKMKKTFYDEGHKSLDDYISEGKRDGLDSAHGLILRKFRDYLK